MKKLFTFGAFVCLVAFSACGDDKQSDLPVVTNDVIEKEVVTSSFTFRVNASFSGLTEDEQLYGKFGVFYIEKGADTESLFQKWLDTGSAGKLKKKVAVVPGTAFGDAGEGFIRCCYATDINKIKIAMERLAELVKEKTGK